MNNASDIPEIHSAAGLVDLVARGEVERVICTSEADPESAKMKPVVGPSLLHVAVDHGHHKEYRILVKLLLRHGHNVDARDDRQVTPLHYAVRHGQLEVQELLPASNADRPSSTYSSWDDCL